MPLAVVWVTPRTSAVAEIDIDGSGWDRWFARAATGQSEARLPVASIDEYIS